jgi:Ni/Co efflux regulator RcnB
MIRKFFTAALAAATLLGAGAVSTPAAAAGAGAGAGEGQYYGSRHHDRYRNCDWRHPTRYGCPRERQYRYGRHHNYRGYHRSNNWRRHVYRCERAYRSYNARTDMYRTRYGDWRRCRL